MKRTLWIIALFLSLIIITIGAVPAQADTGLLNASRIKIDSGRSSNWAGYVVEYPYLTNVNSKVVYVVSGSWVVPEVKASNPISYSSIWVGIDGYNSHTVEQIGTAQISDGTYYAWYEMYPDPAYVIYNVPIEPGDSIYAEVRCQGKTSFTMTIMNLTTGDSFTTTQESTTAQCTSAEWIVEAPWWQQTLPLANFGTVLFTGASALVNGSFEAFICVDMFLSLTALKADTIPTEGSSDFIVVWKHQ